MKIRHEIGKYEIMNNLGKLPNIYIYIKGGSLGLFEYLIILLNIYIPRISHHVITMRNFLTSDLKVLIRSFKPMTTSIS